MLVFAVGSQTTLPNIGMTVLFARFAFHECLTRTAASGLALFVADTLLMF